MALEAWEHVADSRSISVSEIEGTGQVLDEDDTSEAVLASPRGTCCSMRKHADVGLLVEPEDVKHTSTILEVLQQGLDGMDSMQKFEAIWRYALVSTGEQLRLARDGEGRQEAGDMDLQSKSRQASSRQWVNIASPWMPKRLWPAKSPTISILTDRRTSSR